ncbi:transglycosylase domain-containing protein [Sphingomonas fennica]|uniref:Penicillin-binding protein n=1 Tax=Edaphosphingomonas fennica TaxID=114404 RepID=A0A2T4I4Q2_9SPHN|nr:PBP1A family penicillin-binding protein [Sphingomonas fennica]PTD24458.1 penicillin-binding protein [Sphingomonas fennica]
MMRDDDPYDLEWTEPEEDRRAPASPRTTDRKPPQRGAAAPRAFWKRWRFWKRVAQAGALIFVLLVGWLAITAPLSRSLKPIAPPSITLLSSDGKPIARKGAIIDRPVVVADLPPHVPQAFMAIEDRRFYSHWGIDPRGIARAAWRNTVAGGVREGGSTITQQLAKVAFLDSDRTAARKLREVLIAFWLEARLSKDEILSRYLSNVYFGDNVYGLRAAALHYFNRQPEKLNVAQAAMLAGLLKAPSRLSPAVNLKGARERQRVVVAAMADAGFLTPAEAAGVPPASLNLRPLKMLPSGTYFADWALPAARDNAGAVYAEQEVKTTLDSRIQRAAEAAVRRAGLGKAQVALVAMRPDGRVVAMIGGKNYADSPFNRATQARRQPGSTFKLFVYLAAIRHGLTPDSLVEDEPITIAGWSPKNNDGRYRGKITLREAFARSSNVAAVRIASEVGMDNVIRAARDLGITSPLAADDATLALGTSGVTLLELTSAYAAIAANAYPVKAHALPDKEQSWYDAFWDRPRAFDGETRAMLLDLLGAAVREGTGRSATLAIDAFGKTGTSQDNRDAIFVGFSGDLVAAVWVGNDDNSPLGGIAGGGLPARIWRDFMSRVVDGAAPPVVEREPAPAAEPDPIGDLIENQVDNLSIAVNGAIGDVDVGLRVGPDGLTISANPGNNRPPEERRGPGPAIAPPPPVPEPVPNGQ